MGLLSAGSDAVAKNLENDGLEEGARRRLLDIIVLVLVENRETEVVRERNVVRGGIELLEQKRPAD
jgi:hypothetical protein